MQKGTSLSIAALFEISLSDRVRGLFKKPNVDPQSTLFSIVADAGGDFEKKVAEEYLSAPKACEAALAALISVDSGGAEQDFDKWLIRLEKNEGAHLTLLRALFVFGRFMMLPDDRCRQLLALAMRDGDKKAIGLNDSISLPEMIILSGTNKIYELTLLYGILEKVINNLTDNEFAERITAPRFLDKTNKLDKKFRAAAKAKAVGEMFARARESAGISKSAMERDHKISRSAIQQFEKGQNSPTLERIQTYADALEMEVHIELVPKDKS